MFVSHPRLRRLVLLAPALLLAAGSQAEDGAAGSPGDPDRHRGETIDPEKRGAIPSDPDARVESPSDLEEFESDLEARTEPIDEGERDAAVVRPTPDEEIEAARRRVVAAHERLAEARERYGRMQRDNYPRGDARAEIIAERDAAREALDRAMEALRELDPSAPAATRD